MSNKITLLPEYIDTIQQSSIDYYKSGTNLLDVFSNYLGELQTSIDLENAKSAENILESTKLVYKQLNDSNFTVAVEGVDYIFDDIFKLYFIEKYQTLSSTLKNAISSNITDNIYFVNYSDDIGNITNETSVLDNSTSPYFDTFDTAFNYPNNIHASLFNKVSKNEINTTRMLGVFTDALLKTSLSGLAPENNNLEIAKSSHGSQLVADNLYIDRLNLFKDPIKSEIRVILKAMGDFVQYFKNINYKDKDPERKAKNLQYFANVEGVQTKINLLKKRILS